MSGYRQMTLLVLLLIGVLAGCASPNLKLYDGVAKPAAEIAQISMPEQLEVARVNGVELKGASGNWSKGDKTLDVTPGRYELLVYYREIWELGNQHDALRSEPALFVIDAVAGQRYRLDYTRPGTYDAARELARNFTGWSQDASGERKASQASGLKFRGGLLGQVGGNDALIADARATTTGAQTVAPIAVTPTPAAVAPTTTSSAPARDWLSLMQGMWQQASADERRAFSQWLAQQP